MTTKAEYDAEKISEKLYKEFDEDELDTDVLVDKEQVQQEDEEVTEGFNRAE